jgi:hypothetical protein
MRITIEMKPEHRARVLELAANRGKKGFSLYLADQKSKANAIQKALALKGSMNSAEAEGLLARARKARRAA